MCNGPPFLMKPCANVIKEAVDGETMMLPFLPEILCNIYVCLYILII